MSEPKGNLWFFPNRRGQWEVYFYRDATNPEEFVGAGHTREEAYRIAAAFAKENDIPFETLSGIDI